MLLPLTSLLPVNTAHQLAHQFDGLVGRDNSTHLTERLVPGFIRNRRATQNFLPPLRKRDSGAKSNFLSVQ